MGAKRTSTSSRNIYKRGSRYIVRFRDPDGRIRERTTGTIAAARLLAKELGTDVSRGEYRPTSKITLGEYAERWGNTFTGRTGKGARPETLADYRRDLKLHIVPFFGARTLLAAIDTQRVKEFSVHLRGNPIPDKPGEYDGLAPNTVRRIIAPLRALLATAQEENLIRTNPTLGLKLQGGPRKINTEGLTPDELALAKHDKALTADELDRLIGKMPEGTPRLLVRFLADTGLRIGELTALVWSDFDVETRHLSITRRRYRGAGPEHLNEPKSKYGTRTISIRSDMTTELVAHRLASPFSGDSEPMFASATGSSLDPGNFTARYLKPAAARAGVPWVGFHTLRHTCATIEINGGVAPVLVQRKLGHHSVAFTLDTYVGKVTPPDADDLPAKATGVPYKVPQQAATGGDNVRALHSPESAS